MECPQCKRPGFKTYANGNIKTGYCQECAHETSEASKDKDPVPVIYIEKPKSTQQKKKRR